MEHQLLALLRQLLTERRLYLRNANILEYNQVTIDGILRRYGWQVRFKAASSERVVRTCIDATR